MVLHERDSRLSYYLANGIPGERSLQGRNSEGGTYAE